MLIAQAASNCPVTSIPSPLVIVARTASNTIEAASPLTSIAVELDKKCPAAAFVHQRPAPQNQSRSSIRYGHNAPTVAARHAAIGTITKALRADEFPARTDRKSTRLNSS